MCLPHACRYAIVQCAFQANGQSNPNAFSRSATASGRCFNSSKERLCSSFIWEQDPAPPVPPPASARPASAREAHPACRAAPTRLLDQLIRVQALFRQPKQRQTGISFGLFRAQQVCQASLVPHRPPFPAAFAPHQVAQGEFPVLPCRPLRRPQNLALLLWVNEPMLLDTILITT